MTKAVIGRNRRADLFVPLLFAYNKAGGRQSQGREKILGIQKIMLNTLSPAEATSHNI